jgi:hypothetical protein
MSSYDRSGYAEYSLERHIKRVSRPGGHKKGALLVRAFANANSTWTYTISWKSSLAIFYNWHDLDIFAHREFSLTPKHTRALRTFKAELAMRVMAK